MADKLGINTEGLDLSEAITKPYTITSTKPQTIKSMADLNKELKVTDQWEGISTQPIDLTKVEEAGVTLERAIQDLVVNVPATAAEMAGETIEHPIQKAATYTAEAMGFAKGSALAGKYITGAGRLAAAGRVAGGLVGGAAGGIASAALSVTELGDATLGGQASESYEDFIKSQELYWKEQGKTDEEVKNILKGAEYPLESIAHDMLTWGARYKEARQALREYQASKQGIDPEYWSNQLLQGGVSIIPAIAVGKVAYGATAKAKTKQITDALTGETKKVLTNKARKQASETAVKAAQAFTTEQMSVDYIEGDIQDYIDKTGDLTLQGFNINSVEAAQAYTYGMLGNYIEFGLGGAEAVALGAWKRAGLNMSMKTGQAIAKTALEEGAEEFIQQGSEFLFRKIDGTTDKTWGDALKESLQAGLYGAVIGGAVGGVSYRIGRNNLAKIYQKVQPNITHEQAIQMAEDTIENSAKALAPENAEARNIIKKNIDMFYQGNENVDEYDKEVMVDELMQSLQIKATRDGTTIAELPEIQKAVVDQIAWWVVGRPDEIVPDVQAILERQKQTEERVAELEAKQEKTAQEIDELDMLETQLEKAEEFKESLEQLRTLNAKMRAVKAIQKQIHNAKVREAAKALREKLRAEKAEQKEQEKAQRKLEREEKRIQREKDKETAKAIAREVQLQKMRDAIELEYATDESMRQALMEAGESKRTVERLKHRGLMRAIKLHGITLDRLTIKTPAEIEAIVAEKQRKADEAARGVTTPKKLFFGKINYQFAKDEGIIEAFGFDPTDTKRAIAMYKYFPKNGGITDWADIMEALEFYGYFTGSYQSGTRINGQYLSDTSEARDLDEQRVKDIVLSNQNLEKYDVVTETPEIFTDAQIHLLETEGMDILLQSGKYSEEQLKQMDYQQLNDALNQLALERAEQELEAERSTEPEDDFDIPEDWQDIADENARLDDMYPAYTAETINIDGTERSVFNSTGERIAQSEAALRNFYKWFGNSKAVDEQGRPIVVYHGSGSRFKKFKEQSNTFFTDNKNVAKSYSERSIVYNVYLKIENPLVVDAKGNYFDHIPLPENISEREMLGDMYSVYEKFGQVGKENPDTSADLLGFYARKKGYDGVIIKNVIDVATFLEETGTDYITFDNKQIKSTKNRGTFAVDDANIYHQDKPGTGKKRGAYFPELDAIARTNNADPTTLLHEFAHYFFEENMRKYNAGGGNEQWRKNWKQTIEALGVPENAGPKQWEKASEAFARGYEAWLMKKEKKAKIAVDGEDKNPNEETYKQFQKHMRDIYTALTNPYFRESWGNKTGQLKPELIAWFEQQAGISTIQGKVARGEITKEEATGQAIAETVAETITGRTDVKEIMIQQLHNDTSRYETPDGNVNKPRERLVALAKEIDENNVIAKGSKYDTHRNMIQVAEDADAFVRADPERAMNIINGIEPEVDGLFKEDLFTAMKRMAVQDGNMQIIEDLYQSEVANGLAKELGQRVAGFRDFTKTDDYDIMSAFNNLDSQFNKAYNTDKGKAKVTEAIAELEQEINTQDSASDAELDAILKEMECQ